jgi:hypothetical protein
MNFIENEPFNEFATRLLGEIENTLEQTTAAQLEINGKLDYIMKILNELRHKP